MERNLAHLSWTDVRDLAKQGVVVLPVGATEQHGPHLPVGTDTLQVTRVLTAALERLPDTVAAWTLPALPYGKSNEHASFPGTVSLSADTLWATLFDIAEGVRRAGFSRLAFLNGHGGNAAVLDVAARDIHAATGLTCFCVQPSFWLQAPFEVSDLEARFGVHAGELETSLMLALEPSLVDMARAVTHFPALPEGELLFGAASVAWLTRDWSASGVFGDATLGSAEKGRALLDHAAERLVALLTQLSTFEPPRG